MIIFNQNICSITLHPSAMYSNRFHVERNYKHKIGKKNWFIPIYEIIPEAIVYNGFSGKIYIGTVDEFNNEEKNDSYFKDGSLYEKAHCIISLNDGSSHKKHFNTEEELKAFVDEIKKQAVHIDIS
jgi:hypothetical protein